jgi:hypothetical protein
MFVKKSVKLRLFDFCFHVRIVLLSSLVGTSRN